jgi:hypothetical protein
MFGATCYLCEVGSRKLVGSRDRRPIRPDAIGTCDECSVHACPQHGDKPDRRFLCADCLGWIGAAIELGGEPVPSAEQPPEPPDPIVRVDQLALTSRRLLAANAARVTRQAGDRLRRGVLGERLTFEARAMGEADELPESRMWTALGISRPRLTEDPGPDDDLLFDPLRPRDMVFRRLEMLEAAAAETRELPDRGDAVNWERLTLFVAVPVVARGGTLGDSPLEIPGGLTLPPRIALLAQACADAPLD